jgi:hypothetical protein
MSPEPGQSGIPYTAEAPPVQLGPQKKKFDYWKAADTLEIVLRYSHAGLRGIIEAHNEIAAKKGPEESQAASNNLIAMAGGSAPGPVNVNVQAPPVNITAPPAQVRAPRR